MRVAFPEESVDAVLERLAQALSPRIVESSASLDPLRRELDEYFAGRRREFDLALDWALIAPFGRRVLRKTAAIPYGGHLSYGEIAAEAGTPRGARAAGNALGSNPIPIVIPCHRVLRSGGALGGYGGGLDRKRFLLELEGALTPRLYSPRCQSIERAAAGAHCAARQRVTPPAAIPWLRAPASRACPEIPLGVQRRLASRARGRDRLAVGVVDEIPGGEHARPVGAGRAALGDHVSVLVERRSDRAPGPTGARGRPR